MTKRRSKKRKSGGKQIFRGGVMSENEYSRKKNANSTFIYFKKIDNGKAKQISYNDMSKTAQDHFTNNPESLSFRESSTTSTTDQIVITGLSAIIDKNNECTVVESGDQSTKGLPETTYTTVKNLTPDQIKSNISKYKKEGGRRRRKSKRYSRKIRRGSRRNKRSPTRSNK